MMSSKWYWPFKSKEATTPPQIEIPVLRDEEKKDYVSGEQFSSFIQEVRRAVKGLTDNSIEQEKRLSNSIKSSQDATNTILDELQDSINKVRVKANQNTASEDVFYRGFELGIKMASKYDRKVIEELRNEAIEEALGRMNGNHKKNN